MRRMVLLTALAAVSMLVVVPSALAWTPTSLSLSCGQGGIHLDGPEGDNER
jgi:hypothetical protein